MFSLDFMNKISLDKAVYTFEIDDVLYPKRDYLLQVYYLFSNFVEFTEAQVMGADIVAFMKEVYEAEGEKEVVNKTLAHFNLPTTYLENYERLKANAHLPLKLFLKKETKELLDTLFKHGKQVAILTDGNPVEQLNKLKHIDWEELSPYSRSLRVFFNDELNFRNIVPIKYIAEQYGVEEDEILSVNEY